MIGFSSQLKIDLGFLLIGTQDFFMIRLIRSIYVKLAERPW